MSATIPTHLAGVAYARRSPNDWRALMRAYARGGWTRKQFCTHHGVALSTFDWWRRRLRQDSPTRAASRSSSPAQANALFVELTHEEKPVATVTPSWEVELELGRGVFLRLRRTAC
jgi:putative transposase